MGYVLLATLAIATTLSNVGDARSDDSFNFATLTPANGGHIAYTDWIAGGRYVQFTIAPDSNHPCSSEYYFLEINGVRAARASNNCSASVYLPSPGLYSWRIVLYLFESGTSVTGGVSTFTIDEPLPVPPPPTVTTSPPVTTSPTITTPTDTTAPVVHAFLSAGYVGRKVEIEFSVKDNSGAARVAIGVAGPSGTSLGAKSTGNIVADGRPVFIQWLIPRSTTPGMKTFCVGALDAAGNEARQRCATLNVLPRPI